MATILEQLIPFRTDNPRGDEPALARHLAEALKAVGPDEVVLEEVTRQPTEPPGAYVYARWGTPQLLVNAHLDTVPPNEGWTGDPFTPRRQDGRLIGLGAADTKGAIAAILSALHDVKPKNVGVLFSGDEERGGHCVAAFLASPHARGLTHAIVCEPTRCHAGTRHRGVMALEVRVEGPGGHSSRADTTRAPLAELARMAVIYESWGRSHRDKGPPGFHGMCLNIARMDGGIAFNVIPAQAQLTLSVRSPPGSDEQALRAELEGIARQHIPDAVVHTVLNHPSFKTGHLASFERWIGKVAKAPVDLGFWTEAALLARAGIDAVVLGPGDIAQAHAPDEWVEIEELEKARQLFMNVFQHTEQSIHGTR